MQGIIDSILNWTLAVDWVGSVKDWVGISKDIIVALAAIATATVAIRGIDTWKNQIKAKIYFDVAHDILSATYKIRDAFAKVRYSVLYPYEIKDALIAKKMNVNENENDRDRYTGPVYEARWKYVENAFSEFEDQVYEGKILLPDDFELFVKRLMVLRIKLVENIKKYVDIYKPEQSFTSEEKIAIHNIVFSKEDKSPDPFAKEVDDTIGDLKTYLLPYIQLDTKKYPSRGSNKKKSILRRRNSG